MRKKQPWYYRLTMPALIILPPLGFVLLWKSPRTSRAKLVISVLYFTFVTLAFAGSVKIGLYGRIAEQFQPQKRVFDVRMDGRHMYVSHEVLPFERKVFVAVVRQIRKSRDPEDAPPGIGRDIVDYDAIAPKMKAYQAVGDEYGLDYEDVQRIYRKVSIILVKDLKE